MEDTHIHQPGQPRESLPATQEVQITTFGRYQIVRKIGMGSFGQVFLVFDPEWDRQLALKVMKLMTNEVAVRRFQREGQAVSQLRHPNIVEVYEVGKEKGYDYMSMEYIEGESLSEILRREKRLALRRAVRIMIKVAHALHYAHENNIVHRDIKPSNIMLRDNEPYLTDFGLARAIRGGSKLSQTAEILGTPAYMPPEQAMGKNREIDERSDVYGIGATLYHLITGQLPFPGENSMEVLIKVSTAPPILPREVNPQIPRDLQNICMRCLEKDRGDRYDSALAVAEDLERFLEGAKTKAPERLISHRQWRWLYEKIVLPVTLACLVILAIVLVAVVHSNKNLARENALLIRERSHEEDKTVEAPPRENDKIAQSLQALRNKIARMEIQHYYWQEELLGKLVGKCHLPDDLASPSQIDEEFSQLDKLLPDHTDVYRCWGKAYLFHFHATAIPEEEMIHHAIEKFTIACAKGKDDATTALFGYQSCHLLFNNRKEKLQQMKVFVNRIALSNERKYRNFAEAAQAYVKSLAGRGRKAHEKRMELLSKMVETDHTFFEAHWELAVAYGNIVDFIKLFGQPGHTERERSRQLFEKARDRSLPNALEFVILYLQAASSDATKAAFYNERARFWFSGELREDLQREEAFQKWQTQFPEYAERYF